MTTFAFWNTNRSDASLTMIGSLVAEFSVDVLAIAEAGAGPAEILDVLNRPGQPMFHYHPAPVDDARVLIFSTFPDEFIQPATDHRHITVRKLDRPGSQSLIFAAVHLPSKTNRTTDDQAEFASTYSAIVEEVEERLGISDTVVFGDFNMNPFERGMVTFSGFHAIGSRAIAQRRPQRTVNYRERRVFYNPVWNHLGDSVPLPSGTYYRSGSEPECHYWNAFDQVLVRPSLLDRFSEDSFSIITRVGSTPLASADDTPDRTYSDHFPITFTISQA